MTTEARSLIGERLQRHMAADAPHQNPDLTLGMLAQRVGTSNQLLSQYLNDVLGLSFFEYVNAARVETVKTLMHDPAHSHLTLLDLAYMAGFNSKSGFNSCFKRATGLTPSQWKKQAAQTCSPIGEDDATKPPRQIEKAFR
jgi:AraC-like DNA-binding protein